MQVYRNVAAVLLLLVPAATQAQVVKGGRYSFRVPIAAFDAEFAGGSWAYSANVTNVGGALAVQGGTGWSTVGLLDVRTVKLADIKLDKKKGTMRLRIDAAKGPDIQLTIPMADSAAAMAAFFAPAWDSVAVEEAGWKSLKAHIFSGAMGNATAEVQERIMTIVDSITAGDSIVVNQFQSKPFLKLTTPESEFTYNTNMTSEPERQAGVLNEVAFPIIRAIGSADTGTDTGYGYAVVAVVKAKALAGQYAWLNRTQKEAVTIYVPVEVARQFAAAEITSQDLVDKSAVMVRGNRIKVDLTK